MSKQLLQTLNRLTATFWVSFSTMLTAKRKNIIPTTENIIITTAIITTTNTDKVI